ncbi:hypothetical protein IV203_021648 [Nitzschia inconspicua]|uniref:Uncharacterized protein n=1 Tax=Nitzschia inconspicua TaxID=303405 RepID=A0A9K3KHC5_9STRA|nr:hypothetical protein IV203_021648 [Nitzschia inconspicua]
MDSEFLSSYPSLFLPTIDFQTLPHGDSTAIACRMQEKGTDQSSVRSVAVLSFNPIVLVRFVPNLDDITSHEQEDLWYSNADYKYIRRREQSLMKQISKQVKSERHRQQIIAQRVWGIQTSQERAARCKIIRKTQLFVLGEQKRCKTKNPDQLAQLYSERSRECAQRARERGMDVETFLRDLDLASVETNKSRNHCDGEMCVEEVSPAMKNQRWSADSSSSTSHVSLPNRGGRFGNVTEMMIINDHQNSPMTVVDVPPHMTLRQRMQRCHAGDNFDEKGLPALYDSQCSPRRKLDFVVSRNLTPLSPIL